jgi:type IV secretion system protein VirB5
MAQRHRGQQPLQAGSQGNGQHGNVSVIPQTPDTWQVDWVETVRDRQGVMKTQPARMRALVTVYTVPSTPQTTEEQVRNNPLGIYVRDFSWSRQP